MKSGLRTTLVFLAPAGVLFPLWSARLGVSPPLWSALSSLRSDLSECFLPLASPCPSPSPATARLGCLAARPRSKVKAPSSQISRRGAEGEACLEVPAEEMRMSCLAFPPCSHDRGVTQSQINSSYRPHPVLLVHQEEQPEDQQNHEHSQDDRGYQPVGGGGGGLDLLLL